MRYFFFDIDGTLLLSGGAGRVAMTQVMSEMFELTELNPLKVHGRTDRGIIRDLFESHELELNPEIHESFSARYHELLPNSMKRCDGRLMPGTLELLDQLRGEPNTRLGILTGNSRSAAWTKLQHFELHEYFDFGGYGDLFVNRNDVAKMALEQCRERYSGDVVSAEQVWVIGDTPNDVSCARSIGANVIAVATGGSDAETLAECEPDFLLADLTEWEKVTFSRRINHPEM